MGRMLSDGDDKLLWVPAGGIADISAPTVEELTAVGVLDISCLVAKNNFSLGATGDETIDDPPLCAKGSSPAPGRTNYEAAMDFYRGTTPDDDEAYETFTGKGIDGFLVHRIGKPSESPIVATDKPSVYGVTTTTPQKIVPDANGGYRKFREVFLVRSELVDERAVVVAD